MESARLIWRLAVYFAIGIATFLLLVRGYRWAMQALDVQFAEAPGVEPAELVGIGQALLLVSAVLAWVVTERLGRDRLGPILPLNSRAIAHLLQGTLWGLAGIGATIGAIAAFGGYQIDGLALSGAAVVYYVLLWLLVAVVNGLAENLAFMGYPLFRVARTTGWAPAILLVGLIFAAAHLGNPGQNPLSIASIFLIGALMAAAVWLTGDMWLSVGIHAGIIVGEDLVFSVPDSGVTYTGHLLASRLTGPAWLSGGDAGPEGSALALPAFGILFALIWLVYRRRPVAAVTIP
ncbi:MAG TPA: CPBP family intramembrane glutamic endopeptidase [Sphingomicrobium sp.]